MSAGKAFPRKMKGWTSAFAATAVLLLPASVAGGDCPGPGGAWMAIEDVQGIAGGSRVAVPVFGRVLEPITGYSLAVGHGQGVRLVEVRPGSPIADHGAEMVMGRIDNDAEDPYGSLFVVLDVREPFGDVPPLPIQERTEIAVFVYEVPEGCPPGLAAELRVRNGAYGTPAVSSIFVDEELDSIVPEYCDGSLRVIPSFRRGDCERDFNVDITDALAMVAYQFLGGAAPPCLDACDSDDSGNVDITDPVHLIRSLFQGGDPPPGPHPEPGTDPTQDELECLGARDPGGSVGPPIGDPASYEERDT